MEATSDEVLPEDSGWQYEPKWDGFRCLAFREGPVVQLQSKSGQSLARYFPELVEVFRVLKPTHFVLDGEIVIPIGQRFSFNDLLQRIHPAESRVRKLSTEKPAMFIAFDILVDADRRSLVGIALSERRKHLQKFASRHFKDTQPLRLSPAITELPVAREWLAGAGADLDGVMAKKLDATYRSGLRDAMVKVKPVRTADCVVGGFRYASKGGALGSLLLGLYDEGGLLHHVGFCSSLRGAERMKALARLEKLARAPGFTGRAPGGPSRWGKARSSDWTPVKPVLVVEVGYDHVSDDRFRNGTGFVRWRPDKAPQQCRMEQIRQKNSRGLSLL
jgi:ATP-dependent DNA ligase